MQLVLDMSATCAASKDMRPNRAVSLAQLGQVFISEFFDQNPLSQMSVVVMRQGCAHVLTELSASPEVHKNAIKSALETGGEVSLQNMLEQCTQVGRSSSWFWRVLNVPLIPSIHGLFYSFCSDLTSSNSCRLRCLFLHTV